MPHRTDTLVFTDLDGTLLEYETYSWHDAQPGIDRLRDAAIPLIAATSKTLAELRKLARQIGLDPPAIVENGSVIAWSFDHHKDIETLGADYFTLCAALSAARESLSLPLVGFSDVEAEEIVERTGLGLEEARLAKERHGDEPFWSERRLSDQELSQLTEFIGSQDLTLTRGDRFFHLKGITGKGRAARSVIARNQEDHKTTRSAGFGDAANDRSLLEAVDISFVVRRTDGSIHPVLGAIQGVRATKGIGPAGFTEGVGLLMEEWSDLGLPKPKS